MPMDNSLQFTRTQSHKLITLNAVLVVLSSSWEEKMHRLSKQVWLQNDYS